MELQVKQCFYCRHEVYLRKYVSHNGILHDGDVSLYLPSGQNNNYVPIFSCFRTL